MNYPPDTRKALTMLQYIFDTRVGIDTLLEVPMQITLIGAHSGIYTPLVRLNLALI